MSKKSFIVGFVIGAVAGSVTAWQLLKKKYEQLVQEEVDSVKAAFERYYTEVEKIITEPAGKPEPEKEEQNTDMTEYNRQISTGGYSLASPSNDCSDPYVIAPEELGGEQGEYNIISLSYFADGVLADDQGNLYNIADAIGEDSLNHFGDFEDETVHVRNEAWNTDFEIFLEERKSTEVF